MSRLQSNDPLGADPSEGARGDLEWRTVGDLVRSSAERFGTALAVVDTGSAGERVELTFEGLHRAGRRVGRALLAMGVERGDRVAIWAPNCWEWIAAGIGAMSVGAALVPLNTRFKGNEAAYVLGRSGARTLLTIDGFLGVDYLDMLRATGDLADGLPALRHVALLRGRAQGADPWEVWTSRAEDVDDHALNRRIAAVQPSDLSDISFTSGTTGRPKGVTSSQAQLLRGYRDWAEVVGVRQGDRYLMISPFFHSFGSKAGWLTALMMGATSYPQAVFRSSDALAVIERERITLLPGAPTLYQSMLNDPRLEDTDTRSLRVAVTGAASVPVELVRQMRERLGFAQVITGYGLSEASGICTMCRYDDDDETVATTAGRPIPGVEVRIAGPGGEVLAPGQDGEVLIRGYNVMAGYWDDPDATADTIVDGWLRTGDIGNLDERGYLRITGRAKDMFIVGGFNAYPAEIEDTLLRHPGIAQVAVVGVPDERMGEVGMAFVIPKHGTVVDPDEVIAWSREEMANYRVPRYVEVVDQLPTNAAGKVVKYELRDRARALIAQRAP